MDKKRIGAITFLILLVGFLLYLVLHPSEKQDSINLEKTQNDVLNHVKSSKRYVKNTIKWMGGNQMDKDIAVFNPPSPQDGVQDPKRDVVDYFLAGLLSQNVEVFLSSFSVQTISEDLFKKTNTDKTEVAKEIIKDITRNGQLKGVKYEDKKGTLGTDTDKLSLILTYKDTKQAKITLQVMPVSDSDHQSEEASVDVITTSAWNIIEQINAQTK